MKAKIKSTGETVNVHEDINGDFVTESGSLYRNWQLEFEKEIDWEQRRYEVAKAALQSLLGNSDAVNATTIDCCRADEYGEQKSVTQAISQYAIAVANVFIAELKKGGTE